jgi:hypothetical protein
MPSTLAAIVRPAGLRLRRFRGDELRDHRLCGDGLNGSGLFGAEFFFGAAFACAGVASTAASVEVTSRAGATSVEAARVSASIIFSLRLECYGESNGLISNLERRNVHSFFITTH